MCVCVLRSDRACWAAVWRGPLSWYYYGNGQSKPSSSATNTFIIIAKVGMSNYVGEMIRSAKFSGNRFCSARSLSMSLHLISVNRAIILPDLGKPFERLSSLLAIFVWDAGTPSHTRPSRSRQWPETAGRGMPTAIGDSQLRIAESAMDPWWMIRCQSKQWQLLIHRWRPAFTLWSKMLRSFS